MYLILLTLSFFITTHLSIAAFTIKDLKFERDENELIQLLSKGYHIFHPEILKHLVKTGSKFYNQLDNDRFGYKVAK